MFNISNFTSEDNPLARNLQAAGPAIDTWTAVAVHTRGRLSRHRIRARCTSILEELVDRLTGLPRQIGDRLFAANDAEANWRGWETINSYGGLGRRYRDPAFDTLGACPKCQGTGIDIDEPCDFCLGSGRLTIAGDDDTGEVS